MDLAYIGCDDRRRSLRSAVTHSQSSTGRTFLSDYSRTAGKIHRASTRRLAHATSGCQLVFAAAVRRQQVNVAVFGILPIQRRVKCSVHRAIARRPGTQNPETGAHGTSRPLARPTPAAPYSLSSTSSHPQTMPRGERTETRDCAPDARLGSGLVGDDANGRGSFFVPDKHHLAQIRGRHDVLREVIRLPSTSLARSRRLICPLEISRSAASPEAILSSPSTAVTEALSSASLPLRIVRGWTCRRNGRSANSELEATNSNNACARTAIGIVKNMEWIRLIAAR